MTSTKPMLILLVLALAMAGGVYGARCTSDPVSGCYVDTNTTLNGSIFNYAVSGGSYAIRVNGTSVVLDCNGSVFIGDKTSNSRGMYINGNNHIIKNCTFQDYAQNIRSDISNNTLLQNLNILNATTYGIYITTNSNNYTLDSSTINVTLSNGAIQMQNCENCTIQNNIFFNGLSNQRSIRIYHNIRLLIENNTFSYITTPIYSNNPNNLTEILNNHILSNNASFFTSTTESPSNNLSISFNYGSNILDNILIYNSNGVTITNNNFSNSTLIGMRYSNNTLISNNIVNNSQLSRYTINLLNNSNITIHSNILKPTMNRMIVIDSQNNNLYLFNNSISDTISQPSLAGGWCIYINNDYGTNKQIYNNTFYNYSGAIQSYNSRNINIYSNNFSFANNNIDGYNNNIHLQHSNNVTVLGNNFSSSSCTGVLLLNTSNSDISQNDFDVDLSANKEYRVNCAYEAITAISAVEVWKSYLQDGTESTVLQTLPMDNRTNKVGFYNNKNISIKSNTYGRYPVYIKSTNTINLSIDLTSFWYRRYTPYYQVEDVSDWYLNNNYQSINTTYALSNGNEVTNRNLLGFGYGGSTTGILTQYIIDKSFLYLKNVNQTSSYHPYNHTFTYSELKLFNLSGYRLTGTRVSGTFNTREANFTLEPQQEVYVYN